MSQTNSNSNELYTKWEDKQTKKLIEKWPEGNIQERLKSRLSKKNSWNQITNYLKACKYVNRNDSICKTRIHNLMNVYGNT